MVELANKLKVEYMFIELLIVYSKYGKELKLNDEQLKEFSKHLKKTKKIAKEYGIDNNFSNFDRNLDEELIKNSSEMNNVVKEDMGKHLHPFLSIPCYDPWFHMTIKADGRVISCDVAIDESDNIKNKSLKDIWYGSYFENYRKRMLSKEIPEFCAQCNPSHTTQRRRLRKELKESLPINKVSMILNNLIKIWKKF